MQAFTRVVNPGTVKVGRTRVNVYVKIDWYHKRLSITGVEGPLRNGDAFGGCGQISLTGVKPAPGWNPSTIAKLAQTWRRWHLNDMRPGCEHQREQGWDKRPIDPSKPLDAYGVFVGEHATWNMLVWVTKREHPQGLLAEPCPVCGYKYGTAWLHEDVPDDVLRWLAALPETTKQPAWV